MRTDSINIACRWHLLIYLIISLLIPFRISQPQNLFRIPSIPHRIIEKKPGHSYYTISTRDSIKVIDNDLTEMINIIVEYKEEPLFSQNNKSLNKAGAGLYHQRQIQFSNDLQNIYKNACRALSLELKQPQRKKEYYKVFNGASLKIPRGMRDGIAGLPYVKKVYKDGIKRTIIKDAVKIVGADSVWSKYQDQGDSIRIGVIDTGIDYMHPALGGGIGPAFKVMGGHDFVNNDNDPMDDDGHGTHVAGIIAANSDSIRGVAPHARLYAYKALDMYGQGYDSDVIAAIEAVSDPDNDGNDADKLDIVNMSLGDYAGNPFDAVTSAVDNAVRAGITFCIAAGNSGDYSTIGSPGTAELAITVGATDKRDNLTEFSSCGPVKKTFIMKPEILAPGDSILSNLPGGKYGMASGTSMASPVVAGVCALLKSRHKDWNPAMIKSAILSSAKETGLDNMKSGAGRINAIKAIEATAFAIPSQLNFGLDEADKGVWEKKDTIQILNSSAVEKNYQINISGLQAGISLTPEPVNFTLRPGEKRSVTFNLIADNSLLQYPGNENISYGGKVRFADSGDTLSVPWSFVKCPYLMVTFNEPYVYYFIYNSQKIYYDYYAWNADDSMHSEILLPPGKYNLVTVFGKLNKDTYENSIVFNSDLELNGFNKINTGPELANLSFQFEGVDESGKKLSEYSEGMSHLRLAFPEPLFESVLGIMIDNKHKLKTTSIPSDVRLFGGQFQSDTKNEKTVRILQFPAVSGMGKNIIFRNSPDDFISQKVNIDLSVDSIQAADITFSNRSPYQLLNYYITAERIHEKKWSGKILLMPETDPYYGSTANIICNDGKSAINQNWESRPFRIDSNKVISILDWNYLSPKDMEINFGEGPFFYTWDVINRPINSNDTYLELFSIGNLNEQRFFCDKNSTVFFFDTNNSIIKQTNLEGSRNVKISNLYSRGEVTSDYYTVAGIHGRLKMLFDLRWAETALPPAITQYRIINPIGVPVSVLKKGEEGRILFSVKCSSLIPLDTSKTKVFIRKSGTDIWEDLKVDKRWNEGRFGLMNSVSVKKYTDTDSAFYDIRINITDNKNRITELTMKPAFAVGLHPLTIIADGNKGNVMPREYILCNNFPNPFNFSTIISYSLPENVHVIIKVFDILGREVKTLADELKEAGNYKLLLEGRQLSSGIYFCRIQAGSYTKTIKLLLQK